MKMMKKEGNKKRLNLKRIEDLMGKEFANRERIIRRQLDLKYKDLGYPRGYKQFLEEQDE